MSRIILPLGDTPIHGYLHHAYPLGIMSLHSNFHPWFNSNYIQLYCAKRFDDLACPVNFYMYQDMNYYPLLDIMRMNRDIILSITDIINFIVNSIHQGYHVLSFIDEFYTPYSENHNKNNYTHDLLISGFDDEEKSLIISSFVGKTYRITKINYDQYSTAFLNATFLDKYNNPEEYKKEIVLFRNNNLEYKFNIELVIYFLEDYLSSTNRLKTSTFPSETHLAFGLDVYKYIKEELYNLEERKVRADIRPLHILWEHKVCMCNRIEYLLDNGYIFNADLLHMYKKIEMDTQHLNLIFLRYRIIRTRQSLQFIRDKLDEILVAEKEILSRLYEEIIANRNRFQII